jgi:hypothetical protein
LDIERYKELLEKEKDLGQQNKSLIFENRDEFIELLSYDADVKSQISYERKKDYFRLISKYIQRSVTPEIFGGSFLIMQREDGEVANVIMNDFERLTIFSVDLKAVEFSSLTSEIHDFCTLAQEFAPEEGISDQKFRKSIEKTHFKMRRFLKE